MAIAFFHSLFGATNIGPCRSCRMQGLPPEDTKQYIPLLPNSPEGSPKGEVNNELAYESSTPLEESIIPIYPLLSVVQDPLLL